MTRKDYVALAAAFARTRPEPDHTFELREVWVLKPQGQWAQWIATRDAVARELQYDNPRFDRARFIRATEA